MTDDTLPIVDDFVTAPTWRAESHTGDGKVHDEHGSYEWVCPFNGVSLKIGTIHAGRIYAHGTRKAWIEEMATEHMDAHTSADYAAWFASEGRRGLN